jgi:hypothetical protein
MLKQFKTRIVPMGATGSWACIKVPFDAAEVFGSRGRIAVKGTVNGCKFRSSIFPDGSGFHFLMVNKAMRECAGIKTGDRVDVLLETDNGSRRVTVPRDLKTALASDAEAAARFGALSHSHKKAYVDWITEAKQPETRKARIEKTLRMLADKKPPKN